MVPLKNIWVPTFQSRANVYLFGPWINREWWWLWPPRLPCKWPVNSEASYGLWRSLWGICFFFPFSNQSSNFKTLSQSRSYFYIIAEVFDLFVCWVCSLLVCCGCWHYTSPPWGFAEGEMGPYSQGASIKPVTEYFVKESLVWHRLGGTWFEAIRPPFKIYVPWPLPLPAFRRC